MCNPFFVLVRVDWWIVPMKFEKIPSIAVTRLAVYARKLEHLDQKGEEVVSSVRLADICRINPAQVRKDLAYFGQFGIRGLGYYVKGLLLEISKILGLDREWHFGLVGVGNLGWALLKHAQSVKKGYSFVAAFDKRPNRIGLKVGDIRVEPLESMKCMVKEKGVEIGVIAVKPEWAQDAADRLVSAGVRGILNFAPVELNSPASVSIENVDFSLKLGVLCYRLTTAKSKRHRITSKLGA